MFKLRVTEATAHHPPPPPPPQVTCRAVRDVRVCTLSVDEVEITFFLFPPNRTINNNNNKTQTDVQTNARATASACTRRRETNGSARVAIQPGREILATYQLNNRAMTTWTMTTVTTHCRPTFYLSPLLSLCLFKSIIDPPTNLCSHYRRPRRLSGPGLLW